MSGFTVEADLLRDILAAIGFLFSDELAEEARERLADPSDATLAALSQLIGIRRRHA